MVAAIIAALAPTLQALIGSASDEAIRRERRTQTKSYLHTLKLQMMDSGLCSQMLAGQILPDGGLLNRSVDIKIKTGVDPVSGANIMLGEGDLVPGTAVRFQSFKLEINTRAKTAAGADRMIVYDWPKAPAANLFHKYYGKILLVPANTNWNIKDPANWFEVAVIIDPVTRVIHQCHGKRSPAEACEMMGGAYDSSGRSPAGLECNPQLVCHNHRVGVVNSVLGCHGLYKGPEEHLYRTLYQPKAVGFFVAGDGRFVCTWCNRWVP